MNVKKLLSKAKWTGRELGKLDVINGVANTVAGTPLAKFMPPELPIPPAKFQEMLYTLAGNAAEIAKWQKYHGLLDFLDRSYAKVYAFHFLTETRYIELFRILAELNLSEQVFNVLYGSDNFGEIERILWEQSFAGLTIPETDYKANLELLTQYRRELINGLIIDEGYNMIILSIAGELDLPEVKVLKLNLEPYKERIKDFNAVSKHLSTYVKKRYSTFENIKTLFNSVFAPLPETHSPPAQWALTLNKDVKSFKAFSGAGNRFKMLYQEVWHE